MLADCEINMSRVRSLQEISFSLHLNSSKNYTFVYLHIFAIVPVIALVGNRFFDFLYFTMSLRWTMNGS